MSQAKPESPTPWTTDSSARVFDANGDVVAACWLNPRSMLPESAEFYYRHAARIAKAVNRDHLFDELVAACRAASELYDRLAYGPLDGAAKFGDTWEPPSDAECVAVREQLDAVLAKMPARDDAPAARMAAAVTVTPGERADSADMSPQKCPICKRFRCVCWDRKHQGKPPC